MSTQPPSSKPNSRWIWPFEILEQIGEGGMGVVYRARYVVNGRNVALKMLPGDVIDKTALARFEREVEVLKTLRHPNIVRCFGGVCEDKRRFYAMELLEGGSLEDQLVAKGKLPWEQVIQYGLQMCAALEYSHEKGVVHRDVKPSNFLMSPEGQLKLSDFGLASVMASRKITAAGKTAGTFLYMAPEQIRGQDVTPRTDLYALGCVLYELVTGQVPFIGETPGATLHLHCNATPVRPTERALDCPVLLERVILKLLQKAPEDRCQSAAEVARELRSITQTVTIKETAKSSSHEGLHAHEAPTQAAIETQTKTAPMDRVSSSVSSGIIVGLTALLVLSFLFNAWQQERVAALKQSHDLWVEALQSQNPEIRSVAARALGILGGRNPDSLELLTEEIDSSDPQVKIAAINGIAESGHAATSLVPRLVMIQKNDEDPLVRSAAAEALSRIRSQEGSWSFPWLRTVLIFTLLAGGIGGFLYWKRS